jgi:hypothetical protein
MIKAIAIPSKGMSDSKTTPDCDPVNTTATIEANAKLIKIAYPIKLFIIPPYHDFIK